MSRAGDTSWSRDIYGWTETWAWPILERGPLPGCADLVLLRLAAHGCPEGTAWPSARGLAEQVGRSERAVRAALNDLRELGYIDGNPEPRKVTKWRFVVDEDEQRHLHHLRTRSAQAPARSSADPSRADAPIVAAADLRTHCGPSADPPRDEVEGEGTSLSTLYVAEGRGQGEAKVIDIKSQRPRKHRAQKPERSEWHRNTRHIDSNRILTTLAHELDAMTAGLELMERGDLDSDVVAECMTSIESSISVINGHVNNVSVREARA